MMRGLFVCRRVAVPSKQDADARFSVNDTDMDMTGDSKSILQCAFKTLIVRVLHYFAKRFVVSMFFVCNSGASERGEGEGKQLLLLPLVTHFIFYMYFFNILLA
ncbi:unnamed protein product [Ceratitis capitata]|uniref:(Mediterranean fruit fly) hypothetical protein n=1 Tax=Ceratitis capitata TaxID=7213 RepID=A0A811UCL1_CERCA|nr:unnamed protein product [Ceratitis capitata]